jgi:hypothetical protein
MIVGWDAQKKYWVDAKRVTYCSREYASIGPPPDRSSRPPSYSQMPHQGHRHSDPSKLS